MSTKEFYDPVAEEFKKRSMLQKYSCYYPQQLVVPKFYEKNCDIFAIQLWKKAYPDTDHVEASQKVMERVEKIV